MFKIGFVIPSWHYFDNPFKLQPIHELHFATAIESEFGDKDVEVSLIDFRETRATSSDISLDTVSTYVQEHDLFLYWIMKTADYPEVAQIVKHLRQLYPESKHIAGGTHVDHCRDECQNDFDSIVLSAGEKSFFSAIIDLRDKNKLEPMYTTPWESNSFDDYPHAQRYYLPKKAIVNRVLFEKYGGASGTSVMFSRGCNFNCTYCVYNKPNKIQFRSPANIESEINYLKSTYNIDGVNLRDEIAIPMVPNVAFPFLEAIGNCNVIWRGQTRVGIKRDSLDLAAQTGCKELSIGVESASNDVRNIIDKRATNEQVKAFIDWSHEDGIKIKLCLILGLPGETKDITKQTIDFIEEMNPDFVAVSGFCPVPGSRIYNDPVYYGVKNINKDWNKHAHLMFRFSDEEEFGLPFEYEETNRWGKTLSRNEIIDSVKEVQHFLRDRKMSY